ncbi:MAG: hypothetical protein WCA13_00460 [Terriglobales bacterium]
MMTIRTLSVMMCMAGMSLLAHAQNAAPTPPRIIPAAEAKNHPGETVTICGKVVDTKIDKYGIPGHGKPVNFDIDQPEPNPVFFFVSFGTQEGGPAEVIAAYKGKRVCVTGKITIASNQPYIMAADRSQIKIQAEGK